jgi:hypothetical protein
MDEDGLAGAGGEAALAVGFAARLGVDDLHSPLALEGDDCQGGPGGEDGGEDEEDGHAGRRAIGSCCLCIGR